MKKQVLTLSALVFVFLLQSTLYSAAKDPVMQIAARARQKSGKVIKVSHKGGNGTLTPQEALTKASPGTILQFAPGNYQDKRYAGINRLTIDKENIIIEGTGTGSLVSIDFVLLKGGCIVRNMWCNRLEAGGVTVVDCRLSPLLYSNKGKTTSYFVNSILQRPNFYANNTKVYIQGCSIFDMFTAPRETQAQWRAGGGGNSYKTGHWGGVFTLNKMEKKGELFLKNNIIYTNGYFYNSWNQETKPLIINFDGNVIYCGKGAITDKDGKESTFKIKDLKDVCRVKESGNKNYYEKTVFRKPPPLRFGHWGGRAWWHYNSYRSIDMIAQPDTTAAKKKLGANINNKGIIEPR